MPRVHVCVTLCVTLICVQVGRLPSSEALSIYCMRLREQGWDIQRVIQRIKTCGGKLEAQVTGGRVRGGG